MNYRRLGNYGIKVSEIALGSWLTYGGVTENEVAVRCIERAYDLGVNFFDTANVYARGKSEEVVGRALSAYRRDSYVIATKVYFPMGDGPNDRGLSRKHIFEQCDQSLKRLGMEYIDLYQCHRYDMETPLEETLQALDDLARQGKILYAGVSEWTAEQIERASALTREHKLHPIVSNQPRYSILQRYIEADVIPASERAGIGQVVFSPLAQGVLTGKYKPGSPLPEDSRAADPNQNQFLLGGSFLNPETLVKVQQLAPLAERAGLSMGQLALAWCLRQPNVSSVITGASRPSQVDDNVVASGKTLPEDILAEIERIFAS